MSLTCSHTSLQFALVLILALSSPVCHRTLITFTAIFSVSKIQSLEPYLSQPICCPSFLLNELLQKHQFFISAVWDCKSTTFSFHFYLIPNFFLIYFALRYISVSLISKNTAVSLGICITLPIIHR